MRETLGSMAPEESVSRLLDGFSHVTLERVAVALDRATTQISLTQFEGAKHGDVEWAVDWVDDLTHLSWFVREGIQQHSALLVKDLKDLSYEEIATLALLLHAYLHD